MEFKEIIINGKKMKLIYSLPEEELDDSLYEQDNDKTADLTNVSNQIQEMEDKDNG